jgi:magnesium transporter
VWLGLREPDAEQMADVARVFGLHELAAEDAVHGNQRPKLERYDDILILVLRTVKYVEHERNTVSEIVETGEIMVFLGPDFVITVRHGEHTGLTGVRHHLEDLPDRLSLGPSAVLHAVADHVVDSYLVVTKEIQGDVEEMEEVVFNPRSTITVEATYQLKREVVELRRAVAPLSSPLQSLSHDTSLPVPKEIRRYFRDVADHHTTAVDLVRDFDESLSALIDAALAKVSMQQNIDMRKISAWAAIAAVPTIFTGIYGMNFQNMPELRWAWGYPMAIALIVAACGGLFLTFRRNDWL